MSNFETKDSGARAEFSNGGVRDTEEGKPRFDLLLPLNVPYLDQVLTRWALLMARGAEKYSDRNWEQFSDEEALRRAYSSAIRHMIQWMNGETDEDHAVAVFFNIMVAEYIKGVLSGLWVAAPSTSEGPAQTSSLKAGDVLRVSRHTAEPKAQVLKKVRTSFAPYLINKGNGVWQWSTTETLDDFDYVSGQWAEFTKTNPGVYEVIR